MQIQNFIISSTNEIMLDEQSINTYKENCINYFDSEYTTDIEYEKIIQGAMTASIHNIVPLLHERLSNLYLSMLHKLDIEKESFSDSTGKLHTSII